MGDLGSIPRLGRPPAGNLPIPVFFLGEFPELRSPTVYSPWSHKESDTTEWLTLSLSPYRKIYQVCLVWGRSGQAKTHGIRCHDPIQTPPASPGSHPTAWLGMLLSCFVNSTWPPFKSHQHVRTCAEVLVRFCLHFSQHYFSDKNAALSEWDIMWMLRMSSIHCFNDDTSRAGLGLPCSCEHPDIRQIKLSGPTQFKSS